MLMLMLMPAALALLMCAGGPRPQLVEITQSDSTITIVHPRQLRGTHL